MKRAINIRLFPSKEQETLMWKHVGSMRYVFNWGLDKQIEHYEATKKKLSVAELGVELTKLKNEEETKWLYEVSNATLKESLRDLDKAYKNFLMVEDFLSLKVRKNLKTSFIQGMIKSISKIIPSILKK